MNAYDKTPVRYDRDQARWSRLRAALRGLLAALVFLVTAVDELVTAVLGVRALIPPARRFGHLLAGEYRAGRAGAVTVDDRERGR